jgi:5'-nucleotidase
MERMKNSKPLILVTNDDGIFAKGIRTLVEEMTTLGEVWVIAPDSPQSGMGHAVTIRDVLRVDEVQYEVEGVRAFACSGTPVDCVKLAVYRVLERKPDLLVSGINHGANSSINVIYSGTMSAAVEGSVEGIPSIGFSLLDFSANADFNPARSYVRSLGKAVLKHKLPKGTCLNVNIPKLTEDQLKGVKICRQANGYWSDAFDKRTDPMGGDYYWMAGKFVNPDKGEDTDEWALANGYVSVVPTQCDLTNHQLIGTLNQWDLKS